MTGSRPLSSGDVDPALLAEAMPLDQYRRHLGLPRETELEGRAATLAAESFAWYRAHGTPWSHTVLRRIQGIQGARVLLESGAALTSNAIAAGFIEAGAHEVALVAASAGARVDEEVDRRWRDSRPDEAMFLSALAVAVAEHLRDRAAASMAADLARSGVVALPLYAPGYEGWGLADQAALVAALDDRGPLRVLPSGGLQPQKSAVAAIGLTRRQDLEGKLAGYWCRRRGEDAQLAPVRYAFPERALAKWSRERLRWSQPHGERLRACFRFDGKTCASLGRTFALEYDVDLEPDGSGAYRIAACACAPAAGDAGHRWMCACLADPEGFQRSLREAPLLGAALDEALGWRPDESPSACLCLPANRNHKWRIVYQTIHYALSQVAMEKDGDDRST